MLIVASAVMGAVAALFLLPDGWPAIIVLPLGGSVTAALVVTLAGYLRKYTPARTDDEPGSRRGRKR